MDQTIQKLLTDKLYDKRKTGAFELESLIRNAVAADDHVKVEKVVNQLCTEYAQSVHQPHTRNGGLIGLAAAAIALGPEVAKYLKEIVPPVLACFTDQDARVRYYACESMYNISKVAKGEILVYFNQVFDALCKLAADSELSVKNGAELLDRLIKDIVSESASTFVSTLQNKENLEHDNASTSTAFSLDRFMPLLRERITVINPFTRMFLVGWISLLDSIPDLELVTYLPSFLGGLIKFLGDPNPDVHTATQSVLEQFLTEINKISRLKKKKIGQAIGQKSNDSVSSKTESNLDKIKNNATDADADADADDDTENDTDKDSDSSLSDSEDDDDDDNDSHEEDDWIPGQDVQIDFARILDILVTFLGGASEQEIQLTALKWIDGLFDINSDQIIAILPRLLTELLPALANEVVQVRVQAQKLNKKLLNSPALSTPTTTTTTTTNPSSMTQPNPFDRRESAIVSPSTKQISFGDVESESKFDLDWESTITALLHHFLNDQEETRAAALEWLAILHRKAPPGRKLEIDDSTFPALLKTLSDPSEQVVSRCLALLSQISRSSDDIKFRSFMVSLLSLFSTDRKLLETRGNLIMRQLCVNLHPERIYRTVADCLEQDDDAEFASIMIQNMNNNLIAAPELADLRRRLRNLDTRDGQTFFVTLFRSWCHNAVATLSLCLLAQAYEQAYHLLTIFADIEMSLNMLIQIDKLVQLLESPVFTYLRLQLLEPDRYPHLYKCLYGLLMLLPQSSAFATLKNRLNAVSAIGYLSTPASRFSSNIATASGIPQNQSYSGVDSSSNVPRPNRLKSRDDNIGVAAIRWNDLFDKFRNLQEKQRKRTTSVFEIHEDANAKQRDVIARQGSSMLIPNPGNANSTGSRPGSGLSGFVGIGNSSNRTSHLNSAIKEKEKSRNPLGLGRFGGGGGAKKKK